MDKTNWTKWSSIAEVVSSIAILVTLIYLGIQTQQVSKQTEQTNNILLSNSRQVSLEGDLAVLRLIADHPEYTLLASISDRELTQLEAAQLNTIVGSIVRIREFSFQQYKAGILDEETWLSYLTVLTGLLQRNNQSRIWWENSRNEFPPDFVAEIEKTFDTEK
jgi:hypothetical protein